MTVEVKHALLKDHKKSLPSTVSTALIWNFPCVTISAVLDAVEIISESVAAAMEASEAALHLFTCLLSLRGVACSRPPSPAASHESDTHTHTHKLPPHLVGKCQQVTWTIQQKQFLCFSCDDGELWVELLCFPHYTFTSSSLTPTGCRLWINNRWHPSREMWELVQAQEDVIMSHLPLEWTFEPVFKMCKEVSGDCYIHRKSICEVERRRHQNLPKEMNFTDFI